MATCALGLGTTLTTWHTGYGKEVNAIFGLPSGIHSYPILPIGWPVGRFGPLGRGPLKDVVFQDQWGKPYADLTAVKVTVSFGRAGNGSSNLSSSSGESGELPTGLG